MSDNNTHREWWAYVHPEDPGGYRLDEEDDGELPRYPKRRVRLIEWPEGEPLP